MSFQSLNILLVLIPQKFDIKEDPIKLSSRLQFKLHKNTTYLSDQIISTTNGYTYQQGSNFTTRTNCGGFTEDDGWLLVLKIKVNVLN